MLNHTVHRDRILRRDANGIFARRPSVVIPASHEPIHQGDEEQAQKHWRCVVHRRSTDRRCDRKRQEDDDEYAECEGIEVDPEPEYTEREGSEGDVLFAEALQYQQADGYEVRNIEGKGRERKEGVQRNRGANVDKREQNDDDGDERY